MSTYQSAFPYFVKACVILAIPAFFYCRHIVNSSAQKPRCQKSTKETITMKKDDSRFALENPSGTDTVETVRCPSCDKEIVQTTHDKYALCSSSGNSVYVARAKQRLRDIAKGEVSVFLRWCRCTSGDVAYFMCERPKLASNKRLFYTGIIVTGLPEREYLRGRGLKAQPGNVQFHGGDAAQKVDNTGCFNCGQPKLKQITSQSHLQVCPVCDTFSLHIRGNTFTSDERDQLEKVHFYLEGDEPIAWIAQDKNTLWWGFTKKPLVDPICHVWRPRYDMSDKKMISQFSLARSDSDGSLLDCEGTVFHDWQDSLIQIPCEPAKLVDMLNVLNTRLARI